MKGDKYESIRSKVNVIPNKLYSLSGRIDFAGVSLNENGTQYNKNIEGDIVKTTRDTIFMLGADPGGKVSTNEYFNGKIYSVRLYNRALSDEEVKHNYEIDMAKFGIK